MFAAASRTYGNGASESSQRRQLTPQEIYDNCMDEHPTVNDLANILSNILSSARDPQVAEFSKNPLYQQVLSQTNQLISFIQQNPLPPLNDVQNRANYQRMLISNLANYTKLLGAARGSRGSILSELNAYRDYNFYKIFNNNILNFIDKTDDLGICNKYFGYLYGWAGPQRGGIRKKSRKNKKYRSYKT